MRRPSTLAPMAESITGAAAPMHTPIRSGIDSASVMTPVTESACTIPTAAEADWRIAVNSAPTRMPSRGFFIELMRFRNQACLPRPLTAPLIVLMPTISTAKPIQMSPTWWVVGFLPTMRSRMPATATTPVSVAVDRMLLRPPLFSI